MAARELRIAVGERVGEVGALLARPPEARALLLLAHGAGADMRHAFMEELAEHLAAHRIASLRFQFPYAERGGRRPDPGPVLLATLRRAAAVAAQEAGGLPLFAGGKSMGGRISALAAADSGLPGPRGLVFFGFPLHAAGQPSAERGKGLERVALPMLFLQGSRDRLADLELLEPLCRKLGARATLHVVPDGDHSFRVPKRTGRSHSEVIEELARVSAEWMEREA